MRLCTESAMTTMKIIEILQLIYVWQQRWQQLSNLQTSTFRCRACMRACFLACLLACLLAGLLACLLAGFLACWQGGRRDKQHINLAHASPTQATMQNNRHKTTSTTSEVEQRLPSAGHWVVGIVFLCEPGLCFSVF